MTQVKAIRNEQGLHAIELTEGESRFIIPAPAIALVANDLIWHMLYSSNTTTTFAPRETDDLSD